MTLVIEDVIQPDNPEAKAQITDAAGLSQAHEAAYSRAVLDDHGQPTLTHEDDPSFKFVVGHFEAGQYIKLGDNGVTTLVYTIQSERVFQHIGQGDVLTDGVDITDKTLEIAAVGNLLQKGR